MEVITVSKITEEAKLYFKLIICNIETYFSWNTDTALIILTCMMNSYDSFPFVPSYKIFRRAELLEKFIDIYRPSRTFIIAY